MTRRKENWPAVLADFIESRRGEPFAWGRQDCCMFAADAVVMMTGIDPAVEVRGRWDSALSAGRLLRSLGGVEEAVRAACARCGFAELAPPLAGRGDIVLTDTAAGPAAGICLGLHAAFPGPSGLTFVLLTDCRAAYRVA
jgi:hypothetical protein